MDTAQKIKAICGALGISQSELARRLHTSPQNLNQRLKVGRFTQTELQEIALAMGAEYISFFKLPDGTEI